MAGETGEERLVDGVPIGFLAVGRRPDVGIDALALARLTQLLVGPPFTHSQVMGYSALHRRRKALWMGAGFLLVLR